MKYYSFLSSDGQMDLLDHKLRLFLLDADIEDAKPKYVSKIVKPNDEVDSLASLISDESDDSLFSDKDASKNSKHMSSSFQELYNEYDVDSEEKGWFGRIKSTTYLQEIVLKGTPQDFRLFQDMIKINYVGTLQESRVVSFATHHFSTHPTHHQSAEHYRERIEKYCSEKYKEVTCHLSIEEDVTEGDGEADKNSEKGSICSGIITGPIPEVVAIKKLLSKEGEAIRFWESVIVFDSK